MKFRATTFLLIASFPAISRADVIDMTVANADWNGAIWGTPAAAPTAGNDYVITAVGNGVARMPANGSSSTFLGDSLTVLTGGHALLKLLDGNTATINGPITLNGGMLNLGPNSASSATLDVTEIRVVGTGSTIQSGFSGRTFTIDGTLTGDGDFTVFGNGGPREVIFTEINNFTGAITVTDDMGLGFKGNSYTFSNSITLTNAATLIVDSGQTLTFSPGDLVDENGPVPTGTYTGASLDALGANYENKGGTIVVADEFIPQLTITPNAANPGNYDFAWDSRAGKVYTLVSETDLSTAIESWAVWDGQEDLVGTVPTSTLSNIPGGGDSRRFFAVLESDAPPILSEDFEGGVIPADWTDEVVSGTGTAWEVGDPTGGFSTGPPAAVSGSNCAGTNIAAAYTSSVDVTLTSPEILIPAGSGALLEFQQFIDTDLADDLGSVRILDSGTNALIGTLEITDIEGDGTGADWTSESLALPAADVGGKGIKIEFRFVSDDTTEFGGFYIDDVVVTLN